MSKRFLHTRLRKQFALSLNTDEVAATLQKLGATVDSRNSDAMPFELVGRDYRITGLIERWQGTDARLRFEGELSLAPFNQTLRNWLLIISGMSIILASLYWVIPWSIQFFGFAGIFIFFMTHFVFALLIAFLLMIPIYHLLRIDPLAQRRWDAQQGLAGFAEAVQILAAEHRLEESYADNLPVAEIQRAKNAQT